MATGGGTDRDADDSGACSRHRPRRTCVGCRTTTDAADLLRLALVREPSAAGEPDAEERGAGERGAGERGAGEPGTDGPGTGPRPVVVDVRRRLGGRGAWLHPDPACLALAERRRAVPRALRVPAPVDLTAVAEHLADDT